MNNNKKHGLKSKLFASFSHQDMSSSLAATPYENGKQPSQFFFFFFFNIYLFGCIGSQLQHVGSFIGVHRLSSCRAQAPEHRGFIVVACGLSCSKACGILVPRLGIEPVSPALRSRFLTTGPPGSPPARETCFNSSASVVLHWDSFVSKETLGNVWSHFRLSQHGEEGVTGLSL